MPDEPAVAPSERAQLIDYVMSLRKDYVKRLLDSLGLPRSGIMVDLRARLERAVDEQPGRVGRIIEFLNDSEPWGKQQVELMRAPVPMIDALRTPDRLRRALAEAGDEGLIDEPRLLGLPAEMELMSASFDDGVIDIRAIEAREYFERDPLLDHETTTAAGLEVQYRAMVRRVTRGIISLRMRPGDRSANLHISQGHRSYDYGNARDRFASLISAWLDLDALQPIDLRPAVAKLHEAEQQALAGGPASPTRAHRLAIRLTSGAVIQVMSSSTDSAMVGDQVVDDTVTRAKGSGTGQLGNVYFVDLPGNPLDDIEVHAVIAAADGRVHIRNPSNEETVEYIVNTIRGLC